MPQTITIFHLTLHLYGLIMGLALVTWYLIWKKVATVIFSTTNKNNSKNNQINNWEKISWTILICMIVGAVVGARLWHVLTSLAYYQLHPEYIWQVWRGGLSIFGALAGGVAGTLVASRYHQQVRKNIGLILDASAIALPWAQAIGRLGNFINQELYGYPTNLPWGIGIDPINRLPQFTSSAKFHPLFAYEIIWLLIIGLVLVRIFWLKYINVGRQHFLSGLPHIPGNLFLLYLTLYTFGRFWLEFLRPDKSILTLPGTQLILGVNQIICAVIFITCVYILFKNSFKK